MSVPTAFFDQLYQRSADPWDFRERWYEQRKRALTLACLPRQHYRSTYELGCANGELSAGLALRTEKLLCCDAAIKAVELTRQRLRHCPNARVEQSRVPSEWPEGRFDLIVLSELAYYLDTDDVRRLVERILDSLAPDGHFLACHWRPAIEGCALTGEQVHTLLHECLGLERLAQHSEQDFVLEVWGRDPTSVASQEGLK